jgi:hypothetical protein
MPDPMPSLLLMGSSVERRGHEVFVSQGPSVPARVEAWISTGQRTLFREIVPPGTEGIYQLSVGSMSKDGQQYAYGYWKRLSTLYVISEPK